VPASSFQATTNGTSGIRLEETNEIVVPRSPDAMRSESLPNSGSSMTATVPFRLNVSNTERGFGWKFQGFESQDLSNVGHYLDLLESENM